MVTHDFTEANYLADKVILVNKGRVIQQGSIEDIFQRPESIFAAQFTGIKNIFWLEKKEDLEEFHLEKPSYIGIRPENIHLNHYSISSFYHFQGEIKRIKNNGVYMEIELKDNKRSYISYLTLNRFFEMSISQGMAISFGFEKEHLIIINKPQ
jgi:ABC-type sugar transport system ATPase subunit